MIYRPGSNNIRSCIPANDLVFGTLLVTNINLADMMPDTPGLMELPEMLLIDVIWYTYDLIILPDWLNLGTVCSAFLTQIDHLILTRDLLNDTKSKGIGNAPRTKMPNWCLKCASMMPPLQYARYLASKVPLLERMYPGNRFSGTVVYVAETILQHELGQGKSTSICHDHEARKKELIYLECENFATAKQERYFDNPPEAEHSPQDFPYWSTDELDDYVAAGAAYVGHGELFLKYLKTPNPVIPGTHNPHYKSRASAAIRGGHIEVVRLLVETGERPDSQDCKMAALYGHLDILKLIYKLQIRSNMMNYADSINQKQIDIRAAMQRAKPECFDFLMSVPIRTEKDFPSEFLWHAARFGRAKYIKRGIEMGANLQWRNLRTDLVPLEAACAYVHTEAVAILLQNGAQMYYDGHSQPMSRAAAHGHLSVIRQLLDGGVDINWEDGLWAYEPIKRGNTRVLRYLLDHGLDPSSLNLHHGQRAMYLAGRNDYTLVLKTLGSLGVSLHKAREGAEERALSGVDMAHVVATVKAFAPT